MTAVGATVSIQGLVSRPELNGRKCQVLSFKEVSGRYDVGLDDGTRLSLKPECVKPLCAICLEDDDLKPIQSSCACRGYSGLAHVACRVTAAIRDSVKAAIRDERNDSWYSC
jgi:hypothetical protein